MLSDFLIPFFLPFLFLCLIGLGWAFFFQKSFLVSLAPAFFLQILIAMLTGIFLEKLNISFLIGAGLAVCAILYSVLIRNRAAKPSASDLSLNEAAKRHLPTGITQTTFRGLILFTVFYILCFFLNTGKYFIAWDEPSHWGMFLKECLRTNRLYCVSPLTFVHKDYVPVFPLAEYIVCKLCRRFTEADAYRALQVFLFSMILPMFEPVLNGKKNPLRILASCILVFAVLFAASLNTMFSFFHSVYVDFAAGILIFYGIHAANEKIAENEHDSLLIMTLSCSILVLSKMTMIAVFPMILTYCFVRRIQELHGRHILRTHAGILIPLVLPLILWLLYNQYASQAVLTTTHQSYSSVSLSHVFAALSPTGSTVIPYLEEVRSAFANALIRTPLLFGLPYAVLIPLLTAAAVGFSFLQPEDQRQKVRLTALWIFVAGLFYALFQYLLYCTMFSEYEAVRIESYERYMATFVLAVVLIDTDLLLRSKVFTEGLFRLPGQLLILAVSACLIGLYPGHITQVLPGTITHDSDMPAQYLQSREEIRAFVPNEAKLFIVHRFHDEVTAAYFRFYCHPINVVCRSVGKPLTDTDIWSVEWSTEKLIEALSDQEYLYLSDLDDAFFTDYADAFADPQLLSAHSVYRILGVEDGKIVLEKLFEGTRAS